MRVQKILVLTFWLLTVCEFLYAQAGSNGLQVKTKKGMVEGTLEASGIRSFKGIPYAAPPVGPLRWREPREAAAWQGVRKADAFGPRAAQLPIFNDMIFRSNGMNEDCLYLNVWAPAKVPKKGLPVLVYFYGGGFVAGDGSEPRYDGENMAKQNIITLTVNYRLGVFGFMAHPELTKESPNKASGNYGLLDQYAALKWVQENISSFGGDPKRVTIAGESAGSISVSAQMASPLSRDLISGAIGESGSIMGTLTAIPLAQAEKVGEEFGQVVGATTLEALRNLPADSLLRAAGKFGPFKFPPAVDGYFFPKSPFEIFTAGEQARVPLLLGWNSEEMTGRALLGAATPTRTNFEQAVRKVFGEKADAVLKVYQPATDEEVMQVATDLAGDRFIGFSTWKWADLHGRTGGKPVYRYYYAHPRPPMKTGNTPASKGAVHSAEIEYVMGNLGSNDVFAWTEQDHRVSQLMQAYFAHFIRTGDPNGKGLPKWPAANQSEQVSVMHIRTTNPGATPERHRERYLVLDQLTGPKGTQ